MYTLESPSWVLHLSLDFSNLLFAIHFSFKLTNEVKISTIRNVSMHICAVQCTNEWNYLLNVFPILWYKYSRVLSCTTFVLYTALLSTLVCLLCSQHHSFFLRSNFMYIPTFPSSHIICSSFWNLFFIVQFLQHILRLILAMQLPSSFFQTQWSLDIRWTKWAQVQCGGQGLETSLFRKIKGMWNIEVRR